MPENKNSRAKIAANNRYTAKTYEKILFRLRKGDDIPKEEILILNEKYYEILKGFGF